MIKMPSVGEYIIKILNRLEEIEKKIDNLVDSVDVKIDLNSRDF